MRIVCVSDTHGRHRFTDVPDGDILVHGGDLTLRGSLEDVEEFDRWLGTLPHRHKVVICGNHDWCFQEQPAEARARITNATYLEDSGCEIEGLTFYGSPWTPLFCDWAFMLPDANLAEKWAQIPSGPDVLITHGPPHGILDLTNRNERAGSLTLLHRSYEVKPRLHVFGHIHEAAGRSDIDGTVFLNASTRMGQGERRRGRISRSVRATSESGGTSIAHYLGEALESIGCHTSAVRSGGKEVPMKRLTHTIAVAVLGAATFTLSTQRTDAGHLGGPGSAVATVPAYQSAYFDVVFAGGERAVITLDGSGTTDLDLFVHANGRVVSGVGSGNRRTVVLDVYRTRPFRTEVQNRGPTMNSFVLRTN